MTQPQTPIYGLPFEKFRGDEPGRTLNAGSTGTSPILAEQVEDELSRIDDDIANLTNVTIPGVDVSASSMVVLDTIDTGGGGNTTEFVNIPQTYRDLIIMWQGCSDGTGEIDSLAIRFNSDGGDNYVSRLSRNTAAGAYTTAQGTFSLIRAGHVGTHASRRSAGTVWIPNYAATGINKLAHGVSNATGQSLGDNSAYTSQAGGYWTGTAAISSVRVWVSSQLWVGNPHITLIGAR